jgi:hypothetical protein
MPRHCSLCFHSQREQISRDLLSGIAYREIARRYSVTIGAISMHLRNHVAGPVRRIIQAETNLAKDCLSVEPVLLQMRRLNNHVLRVLTIAEASKDQAMVLAAVKEARENLTVIAKITGELDPRSLAPEDGKLQVTIRYYDKPLPEPARPQGQIIEALPAPTEDKPN